MLHLSEVLMKNHDMKSFAELKEALKGEARQGQMFFEIDVKPQFDDTPNDWENQLEAAFTSR
jgi:hypothetical protein